MKKSFLLIALFTLSISAQRINAQDNRIDLTGWDLGLNFGFYVPPAYHAHFYNGAAENVNNLDFIFGNSFQYNDIYNSLNANDTIIITGMPQNMRYTSTFTGGIYFRRTFKNDLGFSIQFNVAKLTATDLFQVEVDPDYILTEPDYRLFNIWGKEDRVNIDIQMSKFFRIKNEMFIPFMELGLNINSTRVQEHKIKINNLEYSLVNVFLNGSYIPGAPQTQYNVQQGGVSIGATASGGLKMVFNENLSIDPGVQLYMQRINLEGYEKFRPGFVFFVRLSLAGFFANYG
jgi:hypothetical protein